MCDSFKRNHHNIYKNTMILLKKKNNQFDNEFIEVRTYFSIVLLFEILKGISSKF